MLAPIWVESSTFSPASLLTPLLMRAQRVGAWLSRGVGRGGAWLQAHFRPAASGDSSCSDSSSDSSSDNSSDSSSGDGTVDPVLGPANGPAWLVDVAACRNHCYNGAPGQLSTCAEMSEFFPGT